MILRHALALEDAKPLASLMMTLGWIAEGDAGAAHVAAMIGGSSWFSVAEVDGLVVGYSKLGLTHARPIWLPAPAPPGASTAD